MLVVTSVFQGDIEAGIRLYNWIAKLSPNLQSHDCLLIADPGTAFDRIVQLKSIANKVFREVRLEVLEKEHKGWPEAANQMFYHAAKYVAQSWPQAWLWLEPDAVPMKPTWLDDLEVEYKRLGRPFMGDIYDVEEWQKDLPKQCMSGIAVYPADISAYFTHGPNPGKAWDMDFASDMIFNGAHTNMVRNRFGLIDLPPTFVETRTEHSPVNAFIVDAIRNECVLFHRNKDGSLIRELDKRLFPEPIKPEKIHTSADYVSLRRNGDIICLLPALRTMADKRQRNMRLVVHREFAPLLEGVSYVDCVPWDGEWEDPLAAASHFHAINAQVFGKGLAPNTWTENFAMLAWKQIGMQWSRHNPLVFDRRDYEREALLASQVFKTNLPKILLKLHGFSSPFQFGRVVDDSVRGHFAGRAEIVNLDEVKAERIYDLVGLMDRAACLVTIDTSALWLAHASPCPVIGFTNGNGFGASPPRGNQILRMDYHQVPAQIGNILQKIESTIVPEGNEDMVLCFSHFIPNDVEIQGRQDRAYATWSLMKARLFAFEPPPQRTSIMLRDPRKMPYVRDMIENAFKSGTEDILVLTNNDIKFDPELRGDILESCLEFGCWWAYRTETKGGKTDNGADVFAMTRKWWKIHQHLLPDFLLGYWWWDDCLTRIMVWSGCHERKRLYYHEPHAGASPTRQHMPGAAHNEHLAMNWLGEHWERRQKVYE